jgi:hypothetical protein
MSRFRGFGVLRGFMLLGDKSEFVVAAPQYRAAANTAMGWKNANLRSELMRLLRGAGVLGWSRLLYSMKFQEERASTQTELQRESNRKRSRWPGFGCCSSAGIFSKIHYRARSYSKRIARRPWAAREKEKRLNETREKVLRLHPPLSH